MRSVPLNLSGYVSSSLVAVGSVVSDDAQIIEHVMCYSVQFTLFLQPGSSPWLPDNITCLLEFEEVTILIVLGLALNTFCNSVQKWYNIHPWPKEYLNHFIFFVCFVRGREGFFFKVYV